MSIDKARKRVRTAALAILSVIFISAPAVIVENKEVPLTGSKDAMALYIQGREKIENLEDPGTLFDQAVQKDPNFAMAYLLAWNTNREFRRPSAKAVALPTRSRPASGEWILAVNEQSNGNPTAWKAHLDELLKLYPNDPRAQSQMGFYYRNFGDDASAVKYFWQAAKLDRTYAPVYNNIGYSNIALGKYADAETAFKTYIKLIPKNPNPYDSYAELLMKTGKYDDSIVQYNKALLIDPTFFNSYRGLGNNYAYKGDYNKARESYQRMYDKVLNDGGRDQALFSTMNSYLAEGKLDEAMKVSEQRRVMAEKASDVQTQIGLYTSNGFVLIESGKLDDAARQFEMADKLRDDPSLPPALADNRHFGKMSANVRLLIARDQFGPAQAQLDEMKQFISTRPNPNQERTWYGLAGMLDLKQKNYSRAIYDFAKVDTTDPYNWYYTAAAYEGSGDSKMAMTLYSKVADWNQLTPRVIRWYGRAGAMARGTELAKGPKQ